MIRQALSYFPWPELVLVGQLMFLGIFLTMLVWIFRKGSATFYDEISRLPLDQEGGRRE